jgi:hypothetical protein
MPEPHSSIPKLPIASLVMQSVRPILDSAPAFNDLSPTARREIEDSIAHVGAYLVAPDGLRANNLPGALAAVPIRDEAGAQKDFLNDVNFPEFVESLIHGVFSAIVDSTIQQMQAYADLLRSVSATVDQFAKDTVADDDGRNWLLAMHPSLVERDRVSSILRISSKQDPAPMLQRIGLHPTGAADAAHDPKRIDKALVLAARRKIAVSRQQIVATMLLMGINRIVVSDGRIRHVNAT